MTDSSPPNTAPTLSGIPLQVGRILVLAIWLWGAASFVTTFPGDALGRKLMLALAGIHLLEMVFLLPMLARKGHGVGAHVLPTFIFGSIHFLSVTSFGAPEAS